MASDQRGWSEAGCDCSRRAMPQSCGGHGARREQVFVEALFAHPSFKAFDKAVLRGLSRRDVVPADFAVLLPFQHRVACQFRAIVADHHTGISAQLGNAIQLASDTCAADGCVDHSGQTFPAE